jgi:hypothetical protein
MGLIAHYFILLDLNPRFKTHDVFDLGQSQNASNIALGKSEEK